MCLQRKKSQDHHPISYNEVHQLTSPIYEILHINVYIQNFYPINALSQENNLRKTCEIKSSKSKKISEEKMTVQKEEKF